MKDVVASPGPPGGEFLFYESEDGRIRLQVRLEEETVWLTQKLMAELFQKDLRTINEHIQNIFEEGELSPDSVIRKFRITAADGKNYDTAHYNLDAIISVGYRVKSQRGTQFRIWATQRLREYIVKGFAMDDDRLKQRGGGNYFEELLARIRDIRSSEKVFWRKILEIYATSLDYAPDTEMSQTFFPAGIFYAQGVKANVLFFERKPAQEKPWTSKLWIYDLRTNQHFTLKENTLKRSDLDDFVACYNPKNRTDRMESERFKCFTYEELTKRDKVNLDIFWLKDDALEESANLPAPEIIAADITADLEAALEQFATIAEDLK